MQRYTYSFEKLEVWKLSRVLVQEIYSLTDGFPNEEKYGMVSQIKRAAVSITCNIAEGAGRKTGKDKANFTQIAFSSLLEVLNLLIVAVDLKFLEEKALEAIRPTVEHISNKLNALRNAQLKQGINDKAVHSPMVSETNKQIPK